MRTEKTVDCEFLRWFTTRVGGPARRLLRQCEVIDIVVGAKWTRRPADSSDSLK
jgi:hypothetical protein